jgi:glycosyltransferase involved in cell wall biosynthesis
MHLHEIKSSQMKPNEMHFNEIEPSKVEPSEMKPNEMHFNEIEPSEMESIGFVVIGRNEGDRLIGGLKSILSQLHSSNRPPIVYVDSGSSDGSVAAAQRLGAHVLELDMSLPFTMARGRNTGFEYLQTHFPQVQFVQFMDGDCELVAGWLEQAIATLTTETQIAIVCGRRRERFPEASLYNRLIDLEWDTPIGDASACGGDALMRSAAIAQVQGYNAALICGEEPEMCLRLRRLGWKIRRIDAEMTRHDAAIEHFSQWWMRSIRGGWFVAEGSRLYGTAPERYLLKEWRSGWLWGLAIPSAAFLLAGVTQGLSLLLLLGYPLLASNIYRNFLRQAPKDHRPKTHASQAGLYAFFCTLSKFPQMLGQLKYVWMRWRGETATLIEYKQPTSASPNRALSD